MKEAATQQDEVQEPVAPIRLALVSSSPLTRLQRLVERAEELVQEILTENEQRDEQ